MVTDYEYIVGLQAYRQMLEPPEGIDFLYWGRGAPISSADNPECLRPVGAVAVVGTQWENLGETYTLEKTNRAVMIDRNSPDDKRTFMSMYKEIIGRAKKSLVGKDLGGIDPDKPDTEDSLVAKAAREMVDEGVITLGGFITIEFTQEGKKTYSNAIVCAEPIAQALALHMRDELTAIETEGLTEKAINDQEKMFAAMTKFVVDQVRTLNPNIIDFLGLNYILGNLPEPKDLRKQLDFAPPSRKRKK